MDTSISQNVLDNVERLLARALSSIVTPVPGLYSTGVIALALDTGHVVGHVDDGGGRVRLSPS